MRCPGSRRAFWDGVTLAYVPFSRTVTATRGDHSVRPEERYGHCVARRATLPLVTTTITQRELRNSSGDIMRRLDAGETFIVTRAGKPVGELSPLRRQRFVTADTVASLFHRAPAIDPDRFRADLDAVADAGIDPRA